MRIRLAIVGGAVAVLAAAWILKPQGTESRAAKRPRPKPVLETRGEVERLETPAPVEDVREISELRSETAGGPRDVDVMALMSEPTDRLPEFRRRFLAGTDPEERLEALHVLLAQHRRFGAELEVDREAMEFLVGVLRDPKLVELHGGAIGALGRWESPEAIAELGRILMKPPCPRDFAQAAETLAELRHPAATATALDFFRGAQGAELRLAGANLLLRVAPDSPSLRSEVRPALERELASATDAWTRKALTKTLNAIR